MFYGAEWLSLAANAAAYSVAVVIRYPLNKDWTFGDTARGRAAILRGLVFVVLNLAGLALAGTAIWMLAQFLHPLVAKAGSIAVSFVWNYRSSHKSVYTESHSSSRQQVAKDRG